MESRLGIPVMVRTLTARGSQGYAQDTLGATATSTVFTSIIDNREGNTLAEGIERITQTGRELWIATAFFSLDALAVAAKNLAECDRVRILFGDEADRKQRKQLVDRMRSVSEVDLRDHRSDDPLLTNLAIVERLFKEKRIEARCYTAKKFHAKAYLGHRKVHPEQMGILGSGNFTRPGLTRNIELNVELTPEQVIQLAQWYEERWAEASEDDVTDLVEIEVRRHLELYEPHAIYLKALLAWGDHVQGREALPSSRLLDVLDPHQEDAFRQALKVIERESGVMVCDGVGLGKSFVALAIMEHYLRLGKRVLLVAPLSILDASWKGYLRTYLSRYHKAFASFKEYPMTWFGFKPLLSEDEQAKLKEKGESAPKPTQEQLEKSEELDLYAEQAEVVVIDESHNFRKTDSQRYANLKRLLQPQLLGKKKVVLLTATPLNTDYQDVAAQFRLITLDHGALGGIPIEQLQREAVRLDDDARKEHKDKQLSIFDAAENLQLRAALESVAIQRSRSTCRALAASRGKTLRFPEREDPSHVAYSLSPAYQHVVDKAHHDFLELSNFIAAYRKAVRKAAASDDKTLKLATVVMPKHGLRLSAYIPDRYRREPGDSLRDAQVESFLVSLVFTNVIKQLESSPEAFLGILRSLGAGLCARLHYVFGEAVEGVLAKHATWVQGNLRHLEADEEAFEEDIVILGDDDREFFDQAVKSRHIHRGLADFGPETHDTKTWRAHIEADLDKLEEIYEFAALARTQAEDEKLSDVVTVIADQLDQGRKVLVFTQSVRTAQYLYRELPDRLGVRVERVDADVQGERRRRLLHEFSPKYNTIDQPDLEFEELKVLVCTDVLSEGVNLQEAGCILNYDLHWNPVRLIQRIGRVDRRLRDDDPVHRFSIFNVVPPPEIERLINLVDTVEGRKRKISHLLGLDQAFFSAEDDAGTLVEFNKEVEGGKSLRDEALESYTETVQLSPEQVQMAEAVPPGGMGVWVGGPSQSLFALFRVTHLPTATPEDRATLEPVLGRPILVLTDLDGSLKITDPTKILSVLSATVHGEPSGNPSNADVLKKALRWARETAFATLRGTPAKHAATVTLECWMEIRP